jgi:hypothetical protein
VTPAAALHLIQNQKIKKLLNIQGQDEECGNDSNPLQNVTFDYAKFQGEISSHSLLQDRYSNHSKNFIKLNKNEKKSNKIINDNYKDYAE